MRSLLIQFLGPFPPNTWIDVKVSSFPFALYS